MTAPDLDELAGLLEKAQQTEADYMNHGGGHRHDAMLDARGRLHYTAVTSLPALLATARRERRLREALEYIKPSLPVLATMCQTVGFMLAEAKARDMYAAVDAALAEEGQDG